MRHRDKDQQREYMKRWREKNREHIREYNKAHYESQYAHYDKRRRELGDFTHVRRALGKGLRDDQVLHHFNYNEMYCVIAMSSSAHKEMHHHLTKIGKVMCLANGTPLDDEDSALVFAQQFDPNSFIITKETK